MAKLDVILAAHSQPEVLSASQVPVAAGLSRYKTPLELYLEKIGSLESTDTSGEAAYWGSRIEALLLAEWAKRNGQWVVGMDGNEEPTLFSPEGRTFHPGTKTWAEWVTDDLAALITDTVRHPTLPLICHLDGIGLAAPGQLGGIIQAKTASAWKRSDWGEAGTDEVPSHILLQVQTELIIAEAVSGRALRNDIPALLGGQEYRSYTTTLNDRVAKLIADLSTDFVRRIRELDPPDVSYDSAGTRALQALYAGDPDHPGLVAEPGTALWDAVQSAVEARRARKAADDAYDRAAVPVQKLMGEATRVVSPIGRINWSASKPQDTTSWKAVAEELAKTHPEAFAAAMAKHTVRKPSSRRFVVTPKEPEDD